MAEQNSNGGNGSSNGQSADIKGLPPTYRFAWLVLNRLGLATLLVLAAAGAGVYWLRYVSAPEAAARLELLRATSENGNRMLSCLDRIVTNEECQLRWQAEWKAFIEAQHRQRSEESKAIMDHQIKAQLFWVSHQDSADKFFSRTDKIHEEQLRVLKELIDELKELRKSTFRDSGA
jgi:hypothetical protein